MSENEKLEFTGERFIPGSSGAQIFYEHAHRYLFARMLAKGRVVLDVGSGEGYGAALLATVARKVLAVELDASATRHAARKYSQDNLRFILGDCTKIPCRSETFDLVVAFEIIEHISGQEEMIAEVKRVLKLDGMLLISTPNKAVYSDEAEYANPFHVREFYIDEFKSFLGKHFPQVHLWGQRVFPGSFIWPLGDGEHGPQKIYPVSSEDQGGLTANAYHLPPMYVIALCLKGRNLEPGVIGSNTSLVDTANGLIEEIRRTLQAEIDKLAGWGRSLDEQLKQKGRRIVELQQEVEELSKWGRRLDVEIAEKDRRILELQREVEQLGSWGKRLNEEIARRDARINQLQGEVEELSAWGRKLDKELEDIRARLIYRALRKLKLLP